ncbi:sulfatase-like hydrolase/transferase [Paenibacillus sp. UMB4589-SE434]|uniref:sulfatase-like hydrolase/transferase n=1 Tax=Paenibacillus sp. UMB4589-SE434 TaxID=3046314 RepID=UPI0025506C6E|nr:sulfatase-like hydrolase/transferase [Paenibacillus sp. UMB4589-SE434]
MSMKNSSNKPNIVFIVTDQQRRDTLSCYDADTLCQTPNLDRLAAEGVVFDNAYASFPVCTPARASMQTGMYPFKHGMQNNTYSPGCLVNELPHTDYLLSRQLKERAGYSVGHTGKWHLGQGPTDRDLFERNLKYIEFPDIAAGNRSLPTDVGYEGDNFPGHGGGGWDYAQFRKYLIDQGLELKIENRISGHYGGHFGAEVTSPVETTVEHYITDRAMVHMDRFMEREEPFMMAIHYWGPHEPYIAPTETLDLYRNVRIPPWRNFKEEENAKPTIHNVKRSLVQEWETFEPFVKHYYAVMTHIDRQVGRIVQYLQDKGVYDDTVIMFCADHGESLGIHGGLCDKGFFMYDETCRIPLIVKPAAGGGAVGRKVEHMVGTCDLYATLLGYAGISDLHQGADGRSFEPIVRGEPIEDWPDAVVTEFTGLGSLLCSQRMIRMGDYKYVFNGGDIDELYDLKLDPHELHNRIQDEEYAEVLRRMRLRLADWMEEHQDHLVVEYRLLRLRDVGA